MYTVVDFFVRIDFSEQYRIKDESWDVSYDEKSILCKTYHQWYVYWESVKVM